MKRMMLMVGMVALFGFAAVLPPVSDASADIAHAITPLPVRLISYVRDYAPAPRPAPRTRAIHSVTDSSLEAPLRSVEWAVKRRDLRACEDIPDHGKRAALVTLCVASVQKDASRCDRISATLDATLHQLCLDLVRA